MLHRILLTFIITTSFTLPLLAQKNNADTSNNKSLDEVVLTATRSERKLSNVTVPVSIITQKTIQQAGSLRLNDILSEQAGLFISTAFGTEASPSRIGVQVQGLTPDYTLIMLNGERLIGSFAGVLDLNRVTVGNIKKVEIVKGPSSSLYGSEALAGVINIITDNSTADKLNASIRYGSFNAIDASIGGIFHINKLSVNAYSNSYTSDGYNAVPPFWRFTNQLQLTYPISPKTKIAVSARYNLEELKNNYAIYNAGTVTYTKGKEVNKDFNINPVITHIINKNLKTSLRLYANRFETSQKLNQSTTASSFYDDYLNEGFYSIENQTDYTLNNKFSFNAGAGYVAQPVRSSRYDDINSVKKNNHGHFFAQGEYRASERFMLITGFRYDKYSLYQSSFSPKLSMLFKANRKISFTASVGKGFKTPAFRQLYLNFTNNAAGGYSVFGSLEAQSQITKLDNEGQILSKEADYYKLTDLKPESSIGINVGMKWHASPKVNVDVNLFRNDIDNMIDYRLVAYYTDGAQIFSYINVNKVYTQGAELNIGYKINKYFSATSGYQLLFTADKNQLEKIKIGNVYTRDDNGISRKMKRDEYVGLPNRSRHMANFKLLFEKNNYFVNTRIMYRSHWAVSDRDGNGVYNTNDHFADGNVQVNISGGTTFNKNFKVQAGCDNLFNYSDLINLPGLAGRNIYISLAYQFSSNKK